MASAMITAVALIAAAASVFAGFAIADSLPQTLVLCTTEETCKHGVAALECCEQWCRVYLRTCLPADREFMHRMESGAAAAAARVVALSRSDADFITQHLLPSNTPVPVTVSICGTTCKSS